MTIPRKNVGIIPAISLMISGVGCHPSIEWVVVSIIANPSPVVMGGTSLINHLTGGLVGIILIRTGLSNPQVACYNH
jgi:hypothetical protein